MSPNAKFGFSNGNAGRVAVGVHSANGLMNDYSYRIGIILIPACVKQLGEFDTFITALSNLPNTFCLL